MTINNPWLVYEVMEALVNNMKDHNLHHLVHPDTYTDRLSAGLVKTGQHLDLIKNQDIMVGVYGEKLGQTKGKDLMKLWNDGETQMFWEDLATALGVRLTIDSSLIGQ